MMLVYYSYMLYINDLKNILLDFKDSLLPLRAVKTKPFL